MRVFEVRRVFLEIVIVQDCKFLIFGSRGGVGLFAKNLKACTHTYHIYIMQTCVRTYLPMHMQKCKSK